MQSKMAMIEGKRKVPSINGLPLRHLLAFIAVLLILGLLQPVFD